MSTLKEILEEALKMRPSEKILVIDGLLQSLDAPDKDIDEIWAIEAEKRLKAYKAGKLKTIPFEEIFSYENVE